MTTSETVEPPESRRLLDRLVGPLLSILQHSLGVDEFGRGRQFRNHFVTDSTGHDGRLCLQLVAWGFMRDCGSRGELTGGMNLFVVTRAGQEAMQRDSPVPPPAKKMTRSQRRYDDFLRADSGVSFREWIGAGV